jgi:excisionase family DNA binding protein
MSPLSTREVAELVSVHLATLEEWLSSEKVKSPKTLQIGGQTYRLWTDRDVERLREYKRKFYRKGRGRKKKALMP